MVKNILFQFMVENLIISQFYIGKISFNLKSVLLFFNNKSLIYIFTKNHKIEQFHKKTIIFNRTIKLFNIKVKILKKRLNTVVWPISDVTFFFNFFLH